MCSDKVGHIREPVLSLELDLSKNGHIEKTAFELSKAELRKMISSLEAANKVRNFQTICTTDPSISEFMVILGHIAGEKHWYNGHVLSQKLACCKIMARVQHLSSRHGLTQS